MSKTGLNAKNLLRLINEYALPTINYYIGVLDREPNESLEIYNMVREVLKRYDIHLQPSCKERLYLPRDEIARGLSNVELKSEAMFLKIKTQFKTTKLGYSRRETILEQQEKQKRRFSLIDKYLNEKYSAVKISPLLLENLQKTSLLNNRKTKQIHQKLFNGFKNDIVDKKESSLWLKRENITPKS